MNQYDHHVCLECEAYLERIAELESQLDKAERINKLKSRQLDSVPLCPDCRDKVHGLPCLRCTIQSLESEVGRLKA